MKKSVELLEQILSSLQEILQYIKKDNSSLNKKIPYSYITEQKVAYPSVPKDYSNTHVSTFHRKQFNSSEAVRNKNLTNADIVNDLISIVNNKGFNPDHRDKVFAQLKTDWPLLYNLLIQFVDDSKFNKNNNQKGF